VWVFLILFGYTLVVFWNTLIDVPRSDHIVAIAYFQPLGLTPSDLPDIAFLEMFGDPRFQPLAWLLHFFEYKAFGSNFPLYHLLVIVFHAVNGVIVFQLVRYSSRSKLFSFLISLLFVSAFTHLAELAWPLHSMFIIPVTLSLLALLSLLKFYRGKGGKAFLYLAYGLAFVQMFFYENIVMGAGFLCLFSIALCWSYPNRRREVFKNISLTATVYISYVALYWILMPRFAGVPEQIMDSTKIAGALAGTPVSLFSAFYHNTFASAGIIFDELVFFAPPSAREFSITSAGLFLSNLNILVWLVLLALILLAKRPARGQIMFLVLLAAWAAIYCFVPLLGRRLGEGITQSRHLYFPTLIMIVILAYFYAPYFEKGWALAKGKNPSFLAGYGGTIVAAALLFFIGLNTAKTSWNLSEYMEYRDYPNAIYYSAKSWLSEQQNEQDRLFISVPTYPPHEKLAWGTDIIPDVLFYGEPRVTKNFQEATHILEWPGTQSAPSIREIESSEKQGSGDDFTITFGFMPRLPAVEHDVLDIFGPAPVDSSGKSWCLRLDFREPVGPTSCRVVLGYYQGYGDNVAEGVVFRSQAVTIGNMMNHFVLVKENDTFGLIFQGRLVDKVVDVTDEDFATIELPLGKLYRGGYRRPYYHGHTFVEFGRSSFHIEDKEVDHVFQDIQFNLQGFQEYHTTLWW